MLDPDEPEPRRWIACLGAPPHHQADHASVIFELDLRARRQPVASPYLCWYDDLSLGGECGGAYGEFLELEAVVQSITQLTQ
jgi:hypothetical protein